MSRNEFAELLWEKGQVMLHGREKSFPSAFPPFSCGGGAGGGSSSAQEKLADGGRSAALPKMGAFGSMAMYPSVNDFPADEDPPPAALDAGRGGDDEEDAVPWIHYPIIDDDDDYCSDLLPELPSAAVTSVSTLLPSQQHNATNRSGEIATGGRERSKECHGLPVPAARPEPPESITKQPRPGGSGEGVMNFSLFSRPAAQARARLQSTQRLQSNGRASNATTSKLTVAERTSRARNIPMLTDRRMPWLQGKGIQFISATSLQAAVPNLQQETARDRVDNSMGGATTAGVPQSSQFQDNVAACKNEGRKAPDVAVATPSVCSGNGAGSDDRWRQLKRRDQAECSASQDEDLEDEFGILRRSATRSTKRSRTAEIHNLSERKRRDRINEKMRALQELIPNCNKIDKASMLDEAIEYLKTLQLQVQMMFMGSGLCIPPMLMPQAMQHLQIPPMAHFPHLGMGLGYGTGAFNMSNTPTVPLPPMQGAQFPCPIISGALQGLGMPGANAVPMFGISGQGIPSSASGVSPFTSLSGLPVRPNLAPQVSGPMANMVQEQRPSFQNQQQQSLNIEGRQEANTCDPQTKIIPQGDKQHFKLPSLAQTNIQFLHASDNMTNSTGKDGAGPSTTAGNCTN